MELENILTIDVEEWYHANFDSADPGRWNTYESRVRAPTRKILELLERTHNKATFFVLGSVAEQVPDLVLQIKSGGHEVASHGYGHHLVYRLTEDQFRQDVIRSKQILERIIGEKIIGYRAPSWSVSKRTTPWVWQVLEESGFRYDSSVFPFKSFLYGDDESSPFMHSITGGTLYEIPPSVLSVFNRRIPFSGGFYFRLAPLPFLKYAIRRCNAMDVPAVVYLHPRELDPDQPRLDLGARDRFIYYHNVEGTEKKLWALLKRFRFACIAEKYGSVLNR